MASIEANASTAEALARAGEQMRRTESLKRIGLVGPAVFVIGLFGISPLVIMLIYSFLVAGTYGGVEWRFTTEAYISFLLQRDIFDETLQFVPDYLQIYFRSFWLAGVTTAVCLVVGFPTAYFMATRPPSQRNFWVFLITLPFWTNLLIRTYAIMLIIRDEGLVNDFLRWVGLIDQPIQILYTNFAMLLGLLYSFLPFMVLPLYSSLEKLDFRLVEAGFDLYATRSQVLRRIVIPLAMPGIVAGCILVFIPALGAYVTPLILGGGKQQMIGSLIATQFGTSRNWPFGSAQAFILMAVVLLALMAYAKSSMGKARMHHG